MRVDELKPGSRARLCADVTGADGIVRTCGTEVVVVRRANRKPGYMRVRDAKHRDTLEVGVHQLWPLPERKR